MNSWLKRFFLVTLAVFILLASVYLARGRSMERSLAEAAIWATVTSAVYVSAKRYHAAKARRCAACEIDRPAKGVRPVKNA